MYIKSTGLLACGIVSLSLFVGSAFAAVTPHVSVMNQKQIGGDVTIAEADIPANGYLAIHASDVKGAMSDQTLGYVALTAGDHKSVKVKLTGSLKPGDKLWATLHDDNGTKGKFEYGMAGKMNVDQPLKVDGKMIEMPFVLQ